MYRVATGHFFIAKGVKFAPGDEITEKAFASKELFLKKVEAGHIVEGKAKADAGGKEMTAAEKKAAVKAAKKKKDSAAKAAETAQGALGIAREELASAAEDQKAEKEKAVLALEAALADAQTELEAADEELAELEGGD